MPEDSVLARTTALVPYLLEHAQANEQARRVSPEGFDALAEAGILKMCGPKKYGGDELPFETQCEVLAEVARGCPSSSWVSTILSAMGLVGGHVLRRSPGRGARRRRSADQRRALADRHARARQRWLTH